MNSFWQLVGFEFKKIFCKKNIQITLMIAAVVSVLSCFGTLLGNSYINGEVFESNYDAMRKDRSYERALSGKTVDSDLFQKTADAYRMITDAGPYIQTEEYQTNARAYSSIYNIMRRVYGASSKKFTVNSLQALTKEQADNFYQLRSQEQVQMINNLQMSQSAKDSVLASGMQIKTPFIFSYAEGYLRFFTIMYPVGLIICFITAICTAPLFSGEYTNGTAQLLLASRHGKRKLIWAKLFTGLASSAFICFFLTGITYITCMLGFGPDGANAPLQIIYPMCPYPFTMGQAALLFSLCIFFGNLLIIAITMLLSAKLKSPFGVIVIICLLIIVPMFINVSETNILLYNLVHMLPTNMLDFQTVLEPIQYELFGLILRPSVFLPVFAAAVCIILLPFTNRSFKEHQIC